MKLAEAAAEFLSHRRIAVAGVSRDHPDAANYVYQRLREAGYEVFAVNPNADIVEGDRCYHALAEIEGGVDGVVIGTHPNAALAVAQDCVKHGVKRVWFHRSFGGGSLSYEAVRYCEKNDIAVIDGGCPRMFLDPVDTPHKCIRWVMGAVGRLPDGERYVLTSPTSG